MTRYSTKAFLTLTPSQLLRQYFGKKNLLSTFAWDRDFEVDQLYEAILNTGCQEQVELDFRTIHHWANDSGIDTLVEESRSPIHPKNDLPGELRDLENQYAQAMYVYLNYHHIFHWAMELKHWENRTGKKHHFVGTALPCRVDPESLKAFGESIAEYYKKQSKGDRCLVDYYMRVNPDRHFFFAYPEDRAKGIRVYEGYDRIVRQAFKPVFEVVFEYNAKDGDLAIHSRGKNSGDVMFEHFCKKVLGFRETPDTKTEVFDLSCLKNPDFRFKEDPGMPLESITLKMVKFQLSQVPGQKVTLESPPCNGDNRIVESMLHRSLMAHGIDSSKIIIERAKIEIKFKPVNMGKPARITFTVGVPQYSTLSDDDKSEMAKRYLRKLGILKINESKKDSIDAA